MITQICQPCPICNRPVKIVFAGEVFHLLQGPEEDLLPATGQPPEGSAIDVAYDTCIHCTAPLRIGWPKNKDDGYCRLQPATAEEMEAFDMVSETFSPEVYEIAGHEEMLVWHAEHGKQPH